MQNHFPDRGTVDCIRKAYPKGCRIVLDRMEDAQAPPIGSQGTVTGVDDIGSAMCAWDHGGSLSLVYGEDRYHTIRTEEEAKVTLDWYGKHQPAENARCPRCGERMAGPTSRHALSRWANIMVCYCCSVEALEKAGMIDTKPMLEWAAITAPFAGEGPWKG